MPNQLLLNKFADASRQISTAPLASGAGKRESDSIRFLPKKEKKTNGVLNTHLNFVREYGCLKDWDGGVLSSIKLPQQTTSL